MDAQPPRAPPAAPHARQRRKRGGPRPRGSDEFNAGGCRVGPAEAGDAAPGKLRRARRRGWRRRGPAAHKERNVYFKVTTLRLESQNDTWVWFGKGHQMKCLC
ncbi:hypothetical protein RLOC_00005703 [Lonchura striata]|uniref:Uncharacterized protein n=1 Tax=Lonchura striata TaxID=40157 RepID=A0A218UNE7_9PASE|nr:hypothetical protein RLOC_00005703 [Lonchura striata domestica]